MSDLTLAGRKNITLKEVGCSIKEKKEEGRSNVPATPFDFVYAAEKSTLHFLLSHAGHISESAAG
jgi:hypothetical protein